MRGGGGGGGGLPIATTWVDHRAGTDLGGTLAWTVGQARKAPSRPPAVPSQVPETTATERNPVCGGQAVEAATVERRRNVRRHGRRHLLAQGASLSTPPGRTKAPHHREAIIIPWRWARLSAAQRRWSAGGCPCKRGDGWRFLNRRRGHEPTAYGRDIVAGGG
jgi:hypothetical protein